MPRTIISRCQTIKFGSVASSEIEEYLIGKNFNQEESKLLSKIACGRPGKALGLAYNHDRREKYFSGINLFFEILRVNLHSRFNLINNFMDFESGDAGDKSRAGSLLEDWQSIVRDIILFQNNSEELISNFQNISQIEQAGSVISPSKLENFLYGIDQAKRYLGLNINHKLIIAKLFISGHRH